MNDEHDDPREPPPGDREAQDAVGSISELAATDKCVRTSGLVFRTT